MVIVVVVFIVLLIAIDPVVIVTVVIRTGVPRVIVEIADGGRLEKVRLGLVFLVVVRVELGSGHKLVLVFVLGVHVVDFRTELAALPCGVVIELGARLVVTWRREEER